MMMKNTVFGRNSPYLGTIFVYRDKASKIQNFGLNPMNRHPVSCRMGKPKPIVMYNSHQLFLYYLQLS